MTAENNRLYSNQNALKADVLSYARIQIENGSEPLIVYNEAKETLQREDLITRPPQGVLGAGQLVSPYRELDNLMRELGHAEIITVQTWKGSGEQVW